MGLRVVRIGTRRSALAMEQARLVGEGLRAAARGRGVELAFELVGITTAGDRILDRPLDEIGGKGLFIREIDRAMLDGSIDIAVHSYKDLPVELDPRIAVGAVSPREDPRDVLVLPAGADAPDARDARALAARLRATGLPVGCSSARRRVQLRELLPGVPVASVRGNVNTRLEKLDAGSYAALVLAAAGLRRLGLEGRIDRAFSLGEMLPAAGQGAMAVTVARGADPALRALLDAYSDRTAALCVPAERAFTRALGGDCSTPCGAYAQVAGGELLLEGLFADPAGGPCLRKRGSVAIFGLDEGERRDAARRLAGTLADEVRKERDADARER